MEDAKEIFYKFIDKTGFCFDAFAEVKDDTDYHRMVAAMLKASEGGDHKFSVGDMLAFRDELFEAGFKWNIDFYMRKIE